MTKSILIIGTGPGIGLATARRFASAGYRIVLASRRLAGLEELARVLRSEGRDVVVEQVDARRPDEVATLVSAYGESLDVLHYNASALSLDRAGSVVFRSISDTPLAQVEDDIAVTLTAAIAAVQAAIHGMVAKKSGTILLTGGGVAIDPHPDLLTLSVGKAGVRNLARGLFEGLRQAGVHIATLQIGALVAPGSPAAEAVADRLFDLHGQSPDAWVWEANYP